MLRANTVALFLSLVPLTAWADGPATVTGSVTEVTVYQGQALVTRLVEAPGDAPGLRELIVTDLPAQILPTSLYAEPSDGIEVRSVRFRTRPVEQDIRAEVRELDTKLQTLRDSLAQTKRMQQVLAERTQYLNGLQVFAAGTAKQELEHGVLNAETLASLTKMVFTQREEIAASELELARKAREQSSQIAQLERERGELTSGSATTVREAVVFVNLVKPGAKLRLRYLVGGASWSPSYNLRASTKRDLLNLEYNAQVQQMSGEDWSDVAMTLSTATPSLLATPPRLEPLAIRLGSTPTPGGPKVAVNAEEYESLKRNLVRSRDRLSEVRNQLAQIDETLQESSAGLQVQAGEPLAAAAGGSLGGAPPESAQSLGRFSYAGRGLYEEFAAGLPAVTASADNGLNYFANEMQLLDLNCPGLVVGKPASGAATAEGVSVSYQLEGRTSLPSRSDRQLIQIARLPLRGDFYRLATPVLTGYVYEEAKLVNSSRYVLLAGPASTFLGEEYVGSGQVPTVSAGEDFTVGLGIDASLRTSRELVDKTETIQGGNRVVDFVYELAIENFAEAAAEVRLIDRIPTTVADDIKITLVDSGPALAEYPEQAADRKRGLLRWDLEVPAKSVGAAHKTLRYTLRIEYDRELSIEGMPAPQQPTP